MMTYSIYPDNIKGLYIWLKGILIYVQGKEGFCQIVSHCQPSPCWALLGRLVTRVVCLAANVNPLKRQSNPFKILPSPLPTPPILLHIVCTGITGITSYHPFSTDYHNFPHTCHAQWVSIYWPKPVQFSQQKFLSPLAGNWLDPFEEYGHRPSGHSQDYSHRTILSFAFSQVSKRRLLGVLQQVWNLMLTSQPIVIQLHLWMPSGKHKD